MRAALAPPAAALGSRVRCSPPGTVSAGLRVPAGWGDAFGGGGAEGCGEGRVSRRGRAPGGRTERGEAWGLAGPPSRRGCSEIRRAAFTCASLSPSALHPQGRSRPPGAWSAEVLRVRLKEGRFCLTLDRRGHFPGSRTWLPRLLSTNQRSLLPASGCVPPAGTWGAVSLAPGTASCPGDCCGPGREDESTAVEQVVLETNWQSLSFIV